MPQKWPNFAFRQFQIAQKWPKFEFFEKKKLQKRLEIAQNGEIWPKKLTFLKKKKKKFLILANFRFKIEKMAKNRAKRRKNALKMAKKF